MGNNFAKKIGMFGMSPINGHPLEIFCKILSHVPYSIKLLPLQRVCKAWQRGISEFTCTHSEYWKHYFIENCTPQNLGKESLSWIEAVKNHILWRKNFHFKPIEFPRDSLDTFEAFFDENTTLWKDPKGHLVVKTPEQMITPFPFSSHATKEGNAVIALSPDRRSIGVWTPEHQVYRQKNPFPCFIPQTPTAFEKPSQPTQGLAFDRHGRIWLEKEHAIKIWDDKEPLPAVYLHDGECIWIGYSCGFIRQYHKSNGDLILEIPLENDRQVKFLAINPDEIFVGSGNSLDVYLRSSCKYLRTCDFKKAFLNGSTLLITTQSNEVLFWDYQFIPVSDSSGPFVKTPTCLINIEKEKITEYGFDGSIKVDESFACVKKQQFFYQQFLCIYWSNDKVEIVDIQTDRSHYFFSPLFEGEIFEIGSFQLLEMSKGNSLRSYDLLTGSLTEDKIVADWAHGSSKRLFILFDDGLIMSVNKATGIKTLSYRGVTPKKGCHLTISCQGNQLLVSALHKNKTRFRLIDLKTWRHRDLEHDYYHFFQTEHCISYEGDAILEYLKPSYQIFSINVRKRSHCMSERPLWFNGNNYLNLHYGKILLYETRSSKFAILHEKVKKLLSSIDHGDELFLKIECEQDNREWLCFNKITLQMGKGEPPLVTPQDFVEGSKGKFDQNGFYYTYQYKDKKYTDMFLGIFREAYVYENKLFYIRFSAELYMMDMETKKETLLAKDCKKLSCYGTTLAIQTLFGISFLKLAESIAKEKTLD